MRHGNRRQRALALLLFALILLCAVTVGGVLLSEQAMVTDFSRKNLAPCGQFLFGTDWMGRDMLSRTLTGLSLSIRIGLLTAAVSAVIALILGGKRYQFEGVVEGRIATEPRGDQGFGYDPLFIPDGYTTSFAQMSAEAKNAISHRGRAVEQLATFLKERHPA